MSNFKDFDLDLRNVASGGNAEPNGTTLVCVASKMTIKQKCNSVETPTTGMKSACCKKKNAADEPQCV